MEKIKQQQLTDKELYEKEKEDWLAQRAEIESEFKILKEKLESYRSISYDTFNALYKDCIGESVTLNSSSSMTFNLQEEKWIDLIKTLSKYRLPQINTYNINNVPSESCEVKEFMRNSIPIQKEFCFNSSKQIQIEGSKYLEELKLVASKTTDAFTIYYTNFSSKEFCEIVSAGKLCKRLNFRYSLIPLDSECDFGSDMDGCIIERIDFDFSGASSYSNWKQYPERFENLIAAIAKCKPLSKSLKTLDFNKCEITKVKAEEVLKKYNLNGIALPNI